MQLVTDFSYSNHNQINTNLKYMTPVILYILYKCKNRAKITLQKNTINILKFHWERWRILSLIST